MALDVFFPITSGAIAALATPFLAGSEWLQKRFEGNEAQLVHQPI